MAEDLEARKRGMTLWAPRAKTLPRPPSPSQSLSPTGTAESNWSDSRSWAPALGLLAEQNELHPGGKASGLEVTGLSSSQPREEQLTAGLMPDGALSLNQGPPLNQRGVHSWWHLGSPSAQTLSDGLHWLIQAQPCLAGKT